VGESFPLFGKLLKLKVLEGGKVGTQLIDDYLLKLFGIQKLEIYENQELKLISRNGISKKHIRH